MNECWPSRSTSFLRSALCSELRSWQGESERHSVAVGKSACFDVATVVEIDGVKAGPTRSHVALRNLKIERSKLSRRTSCSSDSSTGFGSSSEFEVALVFEKPGRFTLPISDITRIRCKYVQQGKASIESRDSLFLLTAASQNELEKLLEVLNDVKAVKVLADSRLCTTCKGKGELKKKKKKMKQKRDQRQHQQPTVLDCIFRKKQLPSLVDANQEQVYHIKDLLRNREYGSQRMSKPLSDGSFNTCDSGLTESEDEQYHNARSHEASPEDPTVCWFSSVQTKVVEAHVVKPSSPTRKAIFIDQIKRRNSVDVVRTRVRPDIVSEQRRGIERRNSMKSFEEKESSDMCPDEDLRKIGDEAVERFAQRRGMTEVLRKVQEEQRRVEEEKKRRDERRKVEVEERREAEETEKMFIRKESLRKLLEQERKRKDDWESKREEEVRWKKDEAERKLKAEEERLRRPLERRVHEQDRLRKETREEEKRKEQVRRKSLMEIRFQEDKKRRKDDEDRRVKELQHREEERKLQEQKQREEERKFQEQQQGEEERKLQELKQREEERRLQELKQREEERRLQELKQREAERRLQELKQREEERRLQELKQREEERRLQELKQREEERRLQEQKQREEEWRLQELTKREEDGKCQELKKKEEERKSQEQKVREEQCKRVREVECRLQEQKRSEEDEKQFKEVLRKLQNQIQEQIEEKRKQEEESMQETMKFFKQEEDRQKLREQEESRKFQESVRIASRLSHRLRRGRVSADAKMAPKEIRKILEEELDKLDPRKLDEDMRRWQTEEDERRAREDNWAMPENERSVLEEQRFRVEEVRIEDVSFEEVTKMPKRLHRRSTSGRTKVDENAIKQAPARIDEPKPHNNASAEVNAAKDNCEFQRSYLQDKAFLDQLFTPRENQNPTVGGERLRKAGETFKHALRPSETLVKSDRVRQEQLKKAELERKEELRKSEFERKEELRKSELERKKAEKAADEEKKRLAQERMKAKLEARRLEKVLKEAQKRAKAEERQRQQKAQEQARQKLCTTAAGLSRVHHLTYRKYEDSWNTIKTSGKKTPLLYSDIPWPPYSNPLFVEAGDSLDAQRRKLRIALLRWHPDKFLSLCGHRLSPLDRAGIEARAKTIAQEVIQWKSKLDSLS